MSMSLVVISVVTISAISAALLGMIPCHPMSSHPIGCPGICVQAKHAGKNSAVIGTHPTRDRQRTASPLPASRAIPTASFHKRRGWLGATTTHRADRTSFEAPTRWCSSPPQRLQAESASFTPRTRQEGPCCFGPCTDAWKLTSSAEPNPDISAVASRHGRTPPHTSTTLAHPPWAFWAAAVREKEEPGLGRWRHRPHPAAVPGPLAASVALESCRTPQPPAQPPPAVDPNSQNRPVSHAATEAMDGTDIAR